MFGNRAIKLAVKMRLNDERQQAHMED